MGLALACGLVCVTAVDCGKKGPPLAPLVHVPAAVGEFSARRFGPTVYLQFVVPNRNQDNSMPADITSVEVYGLTGKPATDEDFVKAGTLIANIAVQPPPREDEDRTRKTKEPEKGGGENARDERRTTEAKQVGFEQGATVTITETLTPELMQPVVITRRVREKPSMQVPAPPPLLAVATADDIPSRVYVAVGVNRKGRRGAFSPRAGVPLLALPPPPADVRASYSEKELTLTWTPPPGVPPRPPVQPEAGYLRGRPIVPGTALAWGYDVFEVPTPAAVSANPSPAPTSDAKPDVPRVEPPLPVNQQPLLAPTFTDSRMEFGVERCYVVRTINVIGRLQQEGEPSDVVCVTPRDTFPPAAPRGLIAVAGDGVISLSWEPNTESDLAGYVILRAQQPGGDMQPLTPEPLTATTFDDKTVKSGVRYVYAVVALDKATPPNRSQESNRIEETAR